MEEAANHLIARSEVLRTPHDRAAAALQAGVPLAWCEHALKTYDLLVIEPGHGASKSKRRAAALSQELGVPIELIRTEASLFDMPEAFVELPVLGLAALIYFLSDSVFHPLVFVSVAALVAFDIYLGYRLYSKFQLRDRAHAAVRNELDARKALQNKLGARWQALTSLDKARAALSLPAAAEVELDAAIRAIHEEALNPDNKAVDAAIASIVEQIEAAPSASSSELSQLAQGARNALRLAQATQAELHATRR